MREVPLRTVLVMVMKAKREMVTKKEKRPERVLRAILRAVETVKDQSQGQVVLTLQKAMQSLLKQDMNATN